MSLQLVKKAPLHADPRMHKTTLFVLRGAERRRAAAQENARSLLRDIGVSLLKRVV